jgi:CRISPR-associated protein Csb1
MAELTYSRLLSAVAGDAVALRASLELQPAGGPVTKVMPPTYGVADNAEHKYATEKRVGEDGTVSEAVLLDSVASQANRMEEALLEGWELGELDFPVVFVDFTASDDLADLGRLSSLEAPHRLADAIFRDSLLDGTLFRLSPVGRAVTDATPRNAAAMTAYCPHALLFGMWDSTGPKGGLGSKFQRAIVSEVVGFDVQRGRSVGSRIDPFDIRKGVSGIRPAANAEEVWTFDEQAAAKGAELRPSEINHGNVTPSIDSRAGGVTISRAQQSVVLSLPALRRLRFPLALDGTPVESGRRRAAEAAARAAVAAIGVAAIAYQHELDFDLRSRCLLVPQHRPRVELLGRNGEEPEPVTLSREGAGALLAEAAAAAAEHRVGFGQRELVLQPAPKLIELLKRSREVAAEEKPAAD